MIAYLAVMALVCVMAIVSPDRKPNRVLWGIAFVVLVLFTGLRHKVGMDWNNYLVMTIRISDGSLLESWNFAEPAYAMLVWLSSRLDAGIYGANLVGAVIMMLGTFRFASRTPLPWVALATAMPFLIVVVGMSANRQAIAAGILLWLVASWAQYSIWRRSLGVLVASLFHFSAIFFLMFVVLEIRMRPVQKVVLAVLMLGAMLAFLQFSGGADYYDQLYVSGQSDVTFSPGAIMHVLLNGVPAILLFSRRDVRTRLFPTQVQEQMALLAMAFVPAALVFSTAAGRMSMYLFPVSMYVFAALPTLFRNAIQRAAIRTLVVVLMAVMLWLWLSYANSSAAHMPYGNVLWMDSNELHL